MSRKASNLLDYGIEEEVDPKVKFDSLISVTVSTIMCLAAKCPLPKSNVDTTKLFLSTITDDNGKTPRNVRGFLSLLEEYQGPYETESTFKNTSYEQPQREKQVREKEKKPSLESAVASKVPQPHPLTREVASSDGQALVKSSTKVVKSVGKEQNKKTGKATVSRIAPSKSMISSKS